MTRSGLRYVLRQQVVPFAALEATTKSKKKQHAAGNHAACMRFVSNDTRDACKRLGMAPTRLTVDAVANVWVWGVTTIRVLTMTTQVQDDEQPARAARNKVQREAILK